MRIRRNRLHVGDKVDCIYTRGMRVRGYTHGHLQEMVNSGPLTILAASELSCVISEFSGIYPLKLFALHNPTPEWEI